MQRSLTQHHIVKLCVLLINRRVMNVQRLEGEYMLTIILHKRPALNNIALLTLPKLLE